MNRGFPGEGVPVSDEEKNDNLFPAEAGRVGPVEGPEETPAERAFWESYEEALAGAGMEEKFWLWNRRLVDRFIRFLKPIRLKLAEPSDVRNSWCEAFRKRWRCKETCRRRPGIRRSMRSSLNRGR